MCTTSGHGGLRTWLCVVAACDAGLVTRIERLLMVVNASSKMVATTFKTRSMTIGRIDENFDLATDSNHCGACGESVRLPMHRRCALTAMPSGGATPAVDLNDTYEDGCECRQVNNGVELCNQLDDDCDGEIDRVSMWTRLLQWDGGMRRECQTVCAADGQGTDAMSTRDKVAMKCATVLTMTVMDDLTKTLTVTTTDSRHV